MNKHTKRLLSVALSLLMLLSCVSVLGGVSFASITASAATNQIQAGDINGDGNVNNKDLTRLMRALAGEDVEVVTETLDVNGDGNFNNKDLTRLMKYLAGEDVSIYPPVIDPPVVCDHDLTFVAAVSATCTDSGNIEYWYCSACGKYFANEAATAETSVDDIWVEATGHTPEVIPAVPAKPGQDGWTEGSRCAVCGEILQEPDGPFPWTGFDITYDLFNGDEYLATVGVNNPNPGYYESDKGLRLQNLKADGYRFLGWYDGAGNNATRVMQIPVGETGLIELYAHWEKIQYTVQYSSEQIPVEITSDKTTFTVDESMTLPVPHLNGYTFVGWSDNNGSVIKSIPVGTIGNQKLYANWLSDRNQAWSKKTLDDPIIYEDTENNQILFTYEVGEIRNVPLSLIHDFGKINEDGVSREITVTYSTTVSETDTNSYTRTASKATTDSFGWSLSNGWSDQTTMSQEWLDQNQLTEEEAREICTNESSNWYVSSGQSGTDTTTTYNSTDTHDLKTTTNNTKTYDNTKTEKRQDFSVGLNLASKIINKVGLTLGASIDIIDIGLEASNQGEKSKALDLKYSNGKTTTKQTGKDTDKGGSTEKGTITHTGSDTVHTGSWNSESGYGGSKSFTESESSKRAVTKLVSEKTGYGQSYIQTANSNETQGFSENNTNTDEYSSVVTYNQTTGTTYTETLSTANTKSGFHRWVNAGIAHVFAVVGYDIASQSYFTTSLSIMDDYTYRYEDYSFNDATYKDNQSGVIDFEVPTDIEDYVKEKVTYSDGLEVSRDGIVTGYLGNADTGYYGNEYTAIIPNVPVLNEEGNQVFDETTGEPITKTVYEGPDDFVIIPEYKVITGLDGKNTVVKVTGISSTAFQENDFIIGIELSDYIEAIPDNAFKNCSSLQFISARDVKRFGNNAFVGCEGLKYAFISDDVTDLGENAFGTAEEIEVVAANANVVKAALRSGAKNITISISDKCTDLEAVALKVPNTVETFKLIGNGRTFEDVYIESRAASTEIINAEFISTGKTPLQIASPVITLQEVKASAPGIALALENDTVMSLYGESFFTSSNEKALLCRKLTLNKIGTDFYSQLHVTGNVLICDNISKLIHNGLLDVIGGIIPITEAEFADYLKGVVKIIFDANGGTVSEAYKTAFFGGSIGALPEPDRDYYNFDGWYTDPVEGTKVTASTAVTSSADMTLYAHWVDKDVSDWIGVSDLPENAQVVDSKWTYTLRSYKESASSSLPGWTQYDSAITGYGSEQGPVYTNPSGNGRQVRSEQYVIGYEKKTQYNYSRWVNGAVNTSGPVKGTWSGVYCGNYQEKGWSDSALACTGSQYSNQVGGYFNLYGSGLAWYNQTTRSVDNPNKPKYGTRWYYRDPIYTYYYYQDNSLEATEDPTGQESVSNVQQWVRYRDK